MSPNRFGAVFDASITLAAGVYGTLIGFRVIGKRPGENIELDRWHGRFGGMFKVIGPLLIVFGLGRILLALVMAP